MTKPMIHIEVLFTKDCPGKDPTLAAIQKVLSESKAEAQIDAILIENEGQALEKAFFGSPTVKINGEDLEPLFVGSLTSSLG